MSAPASTPRRAARARRAQRVRVRRTALVVALAGLLLLAVGLVLGGSRDRLAAGTTIAGVNVGGLDAATAESVLQRRATAVERVPVRFTAGGKSWELSPSQLGVRVDWAAAIRRAGAGDSGFRPVRGLRRIQTRLFGVDVTPRASAFESVLDYTVRAIARQVDRPAREPALRRVGLGVTIVDGREGRRLDRGATTGLMVAALASLERSGPVHLPLVTEQPRLRSESLAEAAARARTALSAPITLVVGETRRQLSRWEIARILRLPSGGETELAIAGPGADRWATGLQRQVNRPPRDASFQVRPGGIEIVPGRAGRALDIGATVERLLRAAGSADGRRVTLPVTPIAPERTTTELRAMGITGVVGSYTTTYGGTEGRLANVRLVAELIDGALVAPGATFSFNATTGERNAEKGFREAPVIINGELRNGIGGGVCQVSTTVFNAAFEAGLPIGRRTNHALYIDHYPLGRDATVNYPDLDLTFDNDTERWILVRTFVGPGSLTVNLYGAPQGRRVESEAAPLSVTGKIPVERTKDPTLLEGSRVVEEPGAPPRETRVVRRVYDASGALLSESTWASSYEAEPKQVRVGTKPRPRPGGGPVAPGAGPGSSTGGTGPATAT